MIQFNLRQNRTAEDVYKDVAIVNGYQPTLKDILHVETDMLTEKEFRAYKYPETVIEETRKALRFTQNDGSVMYKIIYDYEATKNNPETDIEFGRRIAQESFAKQDADLAGRAETIRAQREYNI